MQGLGGYKVSVAEEVEAKRGEGRAVLQFTVSNAQPCSTHAYAAFFFSIAVGDGWALRYG